MAAEQGSRGPIEGFCSYTHQDEARVQEVLASLQGVVTQGRLSLWHDRHIYAGREWVTEIDGHLNTAQLILLFVSSAFLASHYCMKIEVPRALERHKRREARVVPVLLEPVNLQQAPF